jgi:hypothetical protein
MILFKILKRLVLALVGLIITASIYFQIKAEQYISSRIESCCFLLDKERASYKPIVLYYFEIVLFDRDFAKDEVLSKLLGRVSKCAESCANNIGGWEQYLIASYFTEEEKIELIKKHLPDSPLLN